MKHHLNNVFKTLLVLLVLTFISCQKPDDAFDISRVELEGTRYKQRSLSLSEIPEIEKFVTTNTNINLSSRTNNSNKAILDENNILEIIDSLDNSNYSIRFRYSDTPVSEFYNLIISQTPTKEIKTPFVLKYKCDKAYLDQYIASGLDFTYFKGTVSLHRYTDFFEVGYYNGRGETCPQEFDDVGDPIPCDTIPIDIGEDGGASSGDGSEGSSDGGSNDTPPIESTSGVDGWLCNHRGRVHEQPADCNHPEEGGVWVVNYGGSNKGSLRTSETKEETTSASDCPECDTSIKGGIAVNTISMSTKRTVLKRLGLSSQAINFIGASANNGFVTSMYNFLVNSLNPFTNEYTVEVEDYVRAILNAWGSNDFSEVFALDLFTQNPYNIWKNISQAERDLIKIFPLEAYGVFKNREIAVQETITRFGNVVENLNGKPDAFRHAYYNVINAKFVGIDIAILFSDAHESETPVALDLEKQMDLFNNNIGHQSINGNGRLSNSLLADLIYQNLSNGDLRYLSPIDYNNSNFWDNPSTPEADDGNHGITSSTQLIPTD